MADSLTRAATLRPPRLADAPPWPGLVLALVVVFGVLTMPNSLPRFSPPAFLRLPLELPVLLLLLALVPERWGRTLCNLAALVLTASLVFTFADIVTYQAFNRPFNLILDLHLLDAAWRLLQGAISTPATVVLVVTLVGAGLLLIPAMVWATRRLFRLARRRRRITTVVSLVVLVVGLGLYAGQVRSPWGYVVTWEARQSLTGHLLVAGRSLGDIKAFRAEAAVDPVAALPDDTLLQGLAGKDVLLVFVESYGRSAIEGDCCALRTRGALERFQGRLDAGGFRAATGWLTSTTVGGQSWLAHGTFLSGLRLDNQRRYDQLVISDRDNLIRDFSRAGWRTVAVMPAITLAWPEGDYFGYEQVYAAADLGYQGRPFNWVTMPDQYTLETFRRLELAREERRPVLAEIALISSHAPWTPIPPVIDWGRVQDGRVFNQWADSGDPPRVVWADPQRIRHQYSLSIEYVLDTLAGFLTTYGGDDLVMIVLGDHQPAPLVTGQGAGREVPVHLISRDERVFQAIGQWGWTTGMAPKPKTPVWPMETVRERLVRAFTPLQ